MSRSYSFPELALPALELRHGVVVCRLDVQLQQRPAPRLHPALLADPLDGNSTGIIGVNIHLSFS